MDTSGFSQVGRHGTLSLLKKQTSPTHGAGSDNVVTSFGIDDEELTFGSSLNCGVRLYYPDVENLHCRLVFEERKAFLAVLGASGVLVDGCKVYPHTSGGSSLVPLSNNSEFEIHGKRFRFTYPPKDVRKALYATPARPPKRALRLSMIHSAQVFSPRPSNDPRENLRILQSPLKNPGRSPMKARSSSPLKATTGPESDEDEEEDEIVLVQTNHPRVVEEDKDLVILEDIPVSLLSPSNAPSSPMQPQLPRTPPRRKSLGGTALHRAVLIRSAQRAVIKAEKEREEEEEEMEVLGAVVDDDDDDEMAAYHDYETHDVEMRDAEDDEEDDLTDEEDEEERQKKEAQKPLWRKSLERIIPWSFTGTPGSGDPLEIPEQELHDEGYEGEDGEGDEEEESNEEEEDESEVPAPLPVRPAAPRTPIRRALGSFMTPQPQQPAAAFPRTNAPAPGAGRGQPVPGRFSLGGEARRIVVQQPWRVRDLVVPPPTPPTMSVDPPASVDSISPMRPIPTHARSAPVVGTPNRARAAPVISEEERKAIQERRRSAVKEVGNIWAGGAPGMSPAKSSGASSIGGSDTSAGSSRRNSVSPVKPSVAAAGLFPARQVFGSPTKGRPLAHAIAEEDDKGKSIVEADKDSEEELDTRRLLEKMKETVDNMKRRRSVVLGGGTGSVLSTPQPAAIQSAAPSSRMSLGVGSLHTVDSGIPKLDFTKLRSPSKPSSKDKSGRGSRSTTPNPAVENTEGDQDLREDKPFSLLRPGALEERRQSVFAMQPPVQQEEQKAIVQVPLPVVTAEAAQEEDDELEIAQSTKKASRGGRSRLLRTPRAAAPEVHMEEEDDEQETVPASEPTSKSATKGSGSRQMSKTSKHIPSTEEEDPAPRKTTAATKRTRKGTAEPEESPKRSMKVVEPEPAEAEVAKAPVKRGRKPRAIVEAPEPEAEGEVEPIPAPPKRGRPKKNATPAIAEESSTQDESAGAKLRKPASKTTITTKPASKGRTVAATKGKVAAEEEDEDDPLGSYDVGKTSPASADADDEDADLPAPPPPRTTTTTKIKPKATTSRKKAPVKQEDDDASSAMDDAPPLATTRVGRSGKANALATAKTPALKATATSKTRGRPKTPATAPAATTSATTGEEKENTPGSGSGGEKDKVSPSEDGPVKVRVSRTRGATGNGARKTAAKVENEEAEEEEAAPPVRARATRVMRTRTKTG